MTVTTDDTLYILMSILRKSESWVLRCHFSFPVASITHGTEYKMNTLNKSISGNRD